MKTIKVGERVEVKRTKPVIDNHITYIVDVKRIDGDDVQMAGIYGTYCVKGNREEPNITYPNGLFPFTDYELIRKL